jgi:hypothetical protein
MIRLAQFSISVHKGMKGQGMEYGPSAVLKGHNPAESRFWGAKGSDRFPGPLVASCRPQESGRENAVAAR